MKKKEFVRSNLGGSSSRPGKGPIGLAASEDGRWQWQECMSEQVPHLDLGSRDSGQGTKLGFDNNLLGEKRLRGGSANQWPKVPSVFSKPCILEVPSLPKPSRGSKLLRHRTVEGI